MSIEFRTRIADLKNATGLLLVNRGSFEDTDIADLFISECVATFRAVGTSTEIPVNSSTPGTARVPLPSLKKVTSAAESFGDREITIVIDDGTIEIGTFRHKHPAIRLGTFPDQRIDLPVNATLLDTLGIGAILTEDRIEEQGLTNRLLDAWEKANIAIASAAGALEMLGVSEKQIRQLVEEQVEASGKRLQNFFKF
jgi:hypothetical protein